MSGTIPFSNVAYWQGNVDATRGYRVVDVPCSYSRNDKLYYHAGFAMARHEPKKSNMYITMAEKPMCDHCGVNPYTQARDVSFKRDKYPYELVHKCKLVCDSCIGKI